MTGVQTCALPISTVMDVSHFDVLETTKAEGSIAIVCHNGESSTCDGQGTTATTHHIPTHEYAAFLEFFTKYPEGKIAEGVIPKCFRSILPTRIQRALSMYSRSLLKMFETSHPSPVVPIFNIDKRPFALLYAYNTADHVKPFVSICTFAGCLASLTRG